MRLENYILDKGEFQFITQHNLDSPAYNLKLKGNVEIINSGKAMIILDIDEVSIIYDYFGNYFSLYANLNQHNHSIFSNCFITSMPSDGKGEVKISVGESFLEIDNTIICDIVDDLKKVDFPYLTGMRFSVDNLEYWIPANNNFNIDYPDSDEPLIIKYTPREPIILYQNDNLEIRLVFNYTIPSIPIIKSASVSETAFIEIRKLNNLKFMGKDELFDYLYRTISLMYLLIGIPVSIKYSKALFKTINSERTYDAEFIFCSNPFCESLIKIDWHEINIRSGLIPFLNEKYRFISNWYNNFSKFLPSINLYISFQIVSNNNVENKFLWLAQSVEALHRRTSDKKLMGDEEFKHMCNSIIEKCPDEHKEWLTQKISYGNEVGFRIRLKELLNPVLEILKEDCYAKYIYLNESEILHMKQNIDKKGKICIKK